VSKEIIKRRFEKINVKCPFDEMVEDLIKKNK
jgi:hypothetical protein